MRTLFQSPALSAAAMKPSLTIGMSRPFAVAICQPCKHATVHSVTHTHSAHARAGLATHSYVGGGAPCW